MKPDSLHSIFIIEQVDIILAVEKFVRRFCVLQNVTYLPLAVWIVATHLIEKFDCFPYLAVVSPTKRCGKTRLLEVLELLCCMAWRGTSPTGAVLYRMLDKHPTWLFDEVEALRGKQLSEGQQAVIAVLNAGHRKGATIPRCEGSKHEVRFFPVYGPKALACIGALPGTLADRSVIINMQRKTEQQPVERFLFARAKADAEPIVEAVINWVNKNDERVRTTYEIQPDLGFLSDRDADLWMPLFALCAVASPDRVPELKKCALKLSGSKEQDDVDDSLPIKLLADVRDVWIEGEERMSTATLLEKLKLLEESPWAESELSPRKFSRMLRPFGAQPRNLRAGSVFKGYLLSDLKEAFSRYLPPKANSAATRATTPMDADENDDFLSATNGKCSG